MHKPHSVALPMVQSPAVEAIILLKIVNWRSLGVKMQPVRPYDSHVITQAVTVVTGFSRWRPGFAPRSVHVGFMSDKVAQ